MEIVIEIANMWSNLPYLCTGYITAGFPFQQLPPNPEKITKNKKKKKRKKVRKGKSSSK
jgi:hypothetical protein